MPLTLQYYSERIQISMCPYCFFPMFLTVILNPWFWLVLLTVIYTQKLNFQGYVYIWSKYLVWSLMFNSYPQITMLNRNVLPYFHHHLLSRFNHQNTSILRILFFFNLHFLWVFSSAKRILRSRSHSYIKVFIFSEIVFVCE